MLHVRSVQGVPSHRVLVRVYGLRRCDADGAATVSLCCVRRGACRDGEARVSSVMGLVLVCSVDEDAAAE